MFREMPLGAASSALVRPDDSRGPHAARCAVAVPALFVSLLLALAVAPGSSAPPPMPEAFDKQTVQRLIDAIDQGHNAIVLKIGLFARRTPQPLAVRDALSLLRSAVGGEKVGSRRWVLLQSVRGFAGLRIGSDTREEGIQAYTTVLGAIEEARKAGAAEDAERAIYDLVATIPGKYGAAHAVRAFECRAILAEAMTAYLTLVNAGECHDFPIPWMEAVDAVGWCPGCESVLDSLHDSDHPASLALLNFASQVLCVDYPAEALAAQKSSRALLGADMPAMERYYARLVNLLVRAGKRSEAIASQREAIKATGHGSARLADLYRQCDDKTGEAAVLDGLHTPDADETDVIDAAKMLLKAYRESRGADTSASDRAMGILTVYLDAHRKRDLEQELRARLTLAQLFVGAGRLDDARTLLADAPARPAMPTPTATLEFTAIERLQKSLGTPDPAASARRETMK